jgi:hypothetical protein
MVAKERPAGAFPTQLCNGPSMFSGAQPTKVSLSLQTKGALQTRQRR